MIGIEGCEGIHESGVQKIDAAQMGDLLKKESATRWNMRYDELMTMCRDRYGSWLLQKVLIHTSFALLTLLTHSRIIICSKNGLAKLLRPCIQYIQTQCRYLKGKLLCSGLLASSRDAADVCDALDKAGVVLRVKDLVYLRPLEVAEMLYQACYQSCIHQIGMNKMDFISSSAKSCIVLHSEL